MTPAQAMLAGRLAMLRKDVEEAALSRATARIIYRTPQGDRTVYLDAPTTIAALDAAHLSLSDRLLKLGVSEHEHIALPAPDPRGAASPDRSSGRGVPRPDRLPRPPKEPS